MTPAPPRDGGHRWVHALALAIVVALHVLFYQWLSHEGRSPWAERPAARELRVEFVAVDRRPEAVEPTAPRAAAEARPRKPRRTVPPVPAPSATPGETGATARDAPLVMEWTEPGPADPGFRLNLPDDRPAGGLAANEPPNLRMRRQISGQDVVEGAAQLLGFWPEGYEGDPCPRTRRNVAGLMTDTRAEGRALLAEELRRQRVACRQ